MAGITVRGVPVTGSLPELRRCVLDPNAINMPPASWISLKAKNILRPWLITRALAITRPLLALPVKWAFRSTVTERRILPGTLHQLPAAAPDSSISDRITPPWVIPCRLR